ncbi:MAG: hypothetical protein ACYDHU_06585 [Acidimicrobiales bacterium]
MTAVVIGAAVWIVIATALAAWFVVTAVAGSRRLPNLADVVRWFLQCWLGRALILAAWAGAGWHLFCQRP